MTRHCLIFGLLGSSLALQLSRRKFHKVAFACGFVAAPTQIALADGVPPVPVDPFNSMCFGFGCNAPQGVEEAGAPAPTDEESIPWQQVMKLIDEKKVTKVEFDSVSMNKAYAFTDDLGRIRIGEGYPIEDGRSWSSPLFVTRILDNNQIKYSYAEGLKRRSAR